MGRPRGIQMLLSPKIGGPPPKQLVLEADSLKDEVVAPRIFDKRRLLSTNAPETRVLKLWT